MIIDNIHYTHMTISVQKMSTMMVILDNYQKLPWDAGQDPKFACKFSSISTSCCNFPRPQQ